MKCQDMERYITLFINDELSGIRLREFIEPIEEFEIALRHHILVFEPKVEHIAQQEKMLYFMTF